MAYSDNFPATRPVFMADFANGGKIDPRATFTRPDTPPTYAAPSAVHYWSNEKHLSSENRVTNSNDLSDWGRIFITRTLSQVGPDGSSNAAKLTGSAGTFFKAISNATLANTSAQTISFFAKEDTHRYIQVSVNADATKFVNFDLNGSGAYSANGSGVTASITPSGGGYLRCVVNFILPSTSVFISFQDSLSAPREGTTSSTGSIYIFGAMSTTLGDATNVAAYVSAGSQIHRAYAPTLKSVATAGQPRFEYSTDGQSIAKGILIEGQFQQLLTYSEDIADSSWGKSSDGVNPTVTVSSNAAVSPAGDLTADLIVESDDSSNQVHRVQKSGITTASGSVYTLSIFAKAAGRNHVHVHYVGGGLNGAGVVNLSTGAVDSVTGNLVSVTTEDCGNGWWRIVAVTGTTTSTASATVLFSTHDGSSTTYTGNGYGSVLLWGANLTQSSHAYSYLKAEGSATTKAAESLFMTDSSLFDNGEGTIVAEFALPSGPTADQATTVTGAVVGITAATSNNYVRLQTDTRTNVYSASMYADGSSQLTISSAGDTGGQFVKKALSFTQNDTTLCRNGTLSTTDTNCVTPSGLQTIQFGAVSPSYTGATASGHYKRVAIYNEALSDTNLQALTS